MATQTIVITYTAGSGNNGDEVTSFTVGGTAYGSLTAANVQQSIRLMKKAVKRVVADKSSAIHEQGCRDK
jgi:hypothetical protein